MDPDTPVPQRREVQVETAYRPPQTAETIGASPRPREHRRIQRRRSPRWFVGLMGCMLAVVLVALLACALIGGLVIGIAFKLANEVTAATTTTQTFTVTGTPSLAIHDASGRVRVQSGTAGAITVQAIRSARDSSQSAAQADLDNIVVTASQTGNRISVGAEFPDGGMFTGSNSVDLLITVPMSANIAADVTAGDIQVEGISGLIELTGGAGTVTLQRVMLADGSRIHLTTGSITASGSVQPGNTVDIQANSGDVTLQLPRETTARLDARTNIGDIHLSGWSLPVTRVNRVGAMAHGVIGNSGSLPAATIHIRVDAGDITVSQQ